MTILTIWKGSSLFKWYVQPFHLRRSKKWTFPLFSTNNLCLKPVSKRDVCPLSCSLSLNMFVSELQPFRDITKHWRLPPDKWRHAGSQCSLCPPRHPLANLFTSKHERQSTGLIGEVMLRTLQKAINTRQNNSVFWSSAERPFCIFLFLFFDH